MRTPPHPPAVLYKPTTGTALPIVPILTRCSRLQGFRVAAFERLCRVACCDRLPRSFLGKQRHVHHIHAGGSEA